MAAMHESTCCLSGGVLETPVIWPVPRCCVMCALTRIVVATPCREIIYSYFHVTH